MSLEVDLLSEMWLTVREYIPQKDRQAVADHVINVVADHSITERELKSFGGTDSYLRRAVEEYLGEEDDITSDGDDDDGDDLKSVVRQWVQWTTRKRMRMKMKMRMISTRTNWTK